MNSILYIVIPCYNEEKVLPITIPLIVEKVNKLIKAKKISKDSKVLLVDDGSKDDTWTIIENSTANKKVEGLKLAGNVGHQNALLAGLMTAKEKADIVISMDSDLQDDIDAIDKFIEKYYEGSNIVYGVRSNRKRDSFLKRSTAALFYKLMSWLGAKTINNAADYRLMDRKSLMALEQYNEVNLYLRGIIPSLGYKSDKIYYERKERVAGKTKYSPRKMIALAMNGITSFSVKPIRLVALLGSIISISSIFFFIYILCSKISGTTVDGWTSLMASIWLIGGMQLLAIGIVGEYIGKIYLETKARPKYIIERTTIEKKK